MSLFSREQLVDMALERYPDLDAVVKQAIRDSYLDTSSPNALGRVLDGIDARSAAGEHDE
ncbi:MAG: hypothetical protein HQL44_02495 [Alphaproteobacteria bacterium]|nr:hypothetical protein [Alphaproteobacteria bacterium]